MTNLGLISRDDADTLHAYTAAGCARHAKQTDVFASWIAASRTERVPQTLVADCMSAYFAGLSTLRPLANLLRTDTATLRASLQEHAPSSGHTEDPGATFEP
jgi:glycerate kinase